MAEVFQSYYGYSRREFQESNLEPNQSSIDKLGHCRLRS